MPDPELSHLHDPVLKHARTDVSLLRGDMSVDEALRAIRERGTEERIIYFYVTGPDDRLTGVLPTRRLLTASLDQRLEEVMIRRVLALPRTATLLEACELFVLHKFLAFPVVDEARRVIGVVDVSVFAEEVLDLPGDSEKADDVFEAIGFRLSQVRGASPWTAFQYRFPWLVTTIASGTVAAFIAGVFEETLAHHLVIAFFLALVLALAESVSIQSMTLTLQTLRSSRPTLRWFLREAKREIATAMLLGLACGSVVFLVSWAWRGAALAAGVIGVSVCGSLLIACVSGLSMPSLLHAVKLDPKIAAGPAALAVTDVLTLLLYLSLARMFL